MSFIIPNIENPGSLQWEHIVKLANDLTVDPNIVNAVYLTESSGDGYLKSGRPKILVEGHVIWKYLVKNKIDPNKYLPKYNDVVYKKWTKAFYKGGEKEYTRLYKAMEIHEDSALCGTSFGAFQVLGENYIDLGYPDVKTFVLKMCQGYHEQLEILGQYLKFKKLIIPMKERNWTKIASVYNGPGYKANRYDEQMATNYLKSIRKHGTTK
jgi:hypothetical protein